MFKKKRDCTITNPDDLASFNEYLKYINEAEARATDQFNKTLLTLSSGALAVSITFLSDNAIGANISSLLTSWAFFGVTIVLELASYFILVHGMTSYLYEVKRYFANTTTDYPNRDDSVYSKILLGINYVGALCFIAGLVATASFIAGRYL